jgi:hypothetical protein
MDFLSVFISFGLGVVVGELISPHVLLRVAMDGVKKLPPWISLLRTIGFAVSISALCGVINVTVYEVVHHFVTKL